MERYNEYKDSGIQWLGEIPSHWGLRRTKYVWQETDNRSEFGSEQLLSVSQYDGVREAQSDSRSESLKGYKIVKQDELVINIMLAWLGGLGVSKHEGIVSPAYCVYKLQDAQNPRFLHYLYRTPIYLAEFARHSTGIVPSRWRMYTDDFGEILTLLPPIEEQNAMVAYLDTATAKIDAAIAQQQKMIDLLNERKQIIINNAVTKGLNPNVKMKDSGVDWIGEIPEHWNEIKLKYVFSRIADGTHFSPETIEDGMPYITATDVRGKCIDFSETKKISQKDYEALVTAGCKPQLNDILLVKDGATTGRVGLMTDNTNCVTLSSVAMLTPQEKHSHLYLMYMMMSDFMQKQILLSMAGAAMPRITLVKLSNFIGVIPPTEEQESIATYIEEACTPIDNAIINATKQISLLQERKQIIINEVVTGKVKVS